MSDNTHLNPQEPNPTERRIMERLETLRAHEARLPPLPEPHQAVMGVVERLTTDAERLTVEVGRLTREVERLTAEVTRLSAKKSEAD